MRIPLVRLSVCVLAQITTATLALSQVLTHGPVIGGVTASTANVFVRTDQAASVVLWYGTDPNLGASLISETFQTTSANDFTKIIPLTNLTAETTYYMNVVVNNVPQSATPYPSFSTFPPPGSSRDFNFVVLADFATVAKLTKEVNTFRSASAELPAFAFIGGDFDHTNPVTLADKRQMFKDLYNPNTRFMSDFVPLILHRMAVVHQWDDHDAGLNNLDKNYPDWDLTQQAFEEYMPTYPLPAVTPGIWQNFTYAQAECFVLDCRSQRDFWSDPAGPEKSMLDGNNLGEAGELSGSKMGCSARRRAGRLSLRRSLPIPQQSKTTLGVPTKRNGMLSKVLSKRTTLLTSSLFREICTWARSTMERSQGFPRCALPRRTIQQQIFVRLHRPGHGAKAILMIPALVTDWSVSCRTRIAFCYRSLTKTG